MQEYQSNNNLNIDSTIEKVTNATLNNWGPYILNTSVDKKFTKKLLEEGSKIPEQYGVKKNLADRISTVRKFNDELWISESLIPYVNQWLEGWNNFSRKSFYPKDANLSSVCINYQEAGEHKPEHIHSSTDLSFAIYLKVPKEIEIEFNNLMLIKILHSILLAVFSLIMVNIIVSQCVEDIYVKRKLYFDVARLFETRNNSF